MDKAHMAWGYLVLISLVEVLNKGGRSHSFGVIHHNDLISFSLFLVRILGGFFPNYYQIFESIILVVF